jgi:hypothetical protein
MKIEVILQDGSRVEYPAENIANVKRLLGDQIVSINPIGDKILNPETKADTKPTDEKTSAKPIKKRTN